MNLNPKKCKDMVISTLKSKQDLQPLLIKSLPLERVSYHKVLCLTLCNILKWKENANEIITNTSKHLFILRVLKRTEVPSTDHICIYSWTPLFPTWLIRSPCELKWRYLPSCFQSFTISYFELSYFKFSAILNWSFFHYTLIHSIISNLLNT